MVKQKLKDIRLKKGITELQMAEAIGKDVSQYSRRENGKMRITDKEWDKLARQLEVAVEDIYEEDNCMVVKNNNGSNGCINISGNITYYNIPDFVMNNLQDYIKLLKDENERLRNNQNI